MTAKSKGAESGDTSHYVKSVIKVAAILHYPDCTNLRKTIKMLFGDALREWRAKNRKENASE